MSDSKAIRRAGDIELKDVVIISSNGVVHNISPQVLSIEIVENIFEPFTTGTITVSDAIDILNLIPMVGNELVRLEFNTPTLDDQFAYKREFYVYNCSDKVKTNDRSSIYQLRIISIEAAIDRGRRVSQTFRGSPEQIVRSLVYDSGMHSSKDLYCENTTNSVVFISNWWTPTKCIDYVTRRAINANGSATYLFYEANGGFAFVSLDSLILAGVKQTFNVSNFATQPSKNVDSTAPTNIELDYQSVLQVSYQNGFDQFNRLATGYYGGEVIAFDGNTQQYIHSRAGKNFEDENHLNQYNPVPLKNTFGVTSGIIQYIPYATQNFDNINAGITDTDIPVRTARQQFFSRLQTSQATIKVYGRCDYFPGMVVRLNVPCDAEISKQDETPYDLLTTGNYLVTSIKHVITSVRHTMNIQLMKDSYIFDISNSGYQLTKVDQTNAIASNQQTSGGD